MSNIFEKTVIDSLSKNKKYVILAIILGALIAGGRRLVKGKVYVSEVTVLVPDQIHIKRFNQFYTFWDLKNPKGKNKVSPLGSGSYLEVYESTFNSYKEDIEFGEYLSDIDVKPIQKFLWLSGTAYGLTFKMYSKKIETLNLLTKNLVNRLSEDMANRFNQLFFHQLKFEKNRVVNQINYINDEVLKNKEMRKVEKGVYTKLFKLGLLLKEAQQLERDYLDLKMPFFNLDKKLLSPKVSSMGLLPSIAIGGLAFGILAAILVIIIGIINMQDFFTKEDQA